MTVPVLLQAHLLYDASALGKRYVRERGDQTIDALFALNLPIVTVNIAYAETANIIRRHYNRGTLSQADFAAARLSLQTEILSGSNVTLLGLSEQAIYASIVLADTYNLNATDAALLYLFREYAVRQAVPCVLVAADRLFLRAAMAEGLRCFNPELIAPADAVPFLAAL